MKPGFLLLEVMIAVTIFCLGASILASWQWQVTLWQREANLYSGAINEENGLCELIIREQLVPCENQCQLPYRLKSELYPITVSLDGAGKNSLNLKAVKNARFIIVRIAWKSVAGNPRSFTTGAFIEGEHV